MTIYDAFGHTIQEGDCVIYNLSGELALGQIISAEYKQRKTNYGTIYDYTIKVKVLKHSGTYNAPHSGISTVRNPNGIVVVKGILDGVSSISKTT